MKMLIFFITNALKILICAVFLLQTKLTVASVQEKNIGKQQLEQKAVDYIRTLFPPPELGEFSYKAVPLDRRIKIKPCDNELHLSIPGNATLKQQTTVLVRCTAAKPWNLYVQVRTTRLLPVVVAKVSLSPGMVMSQDNVTVMLKDSRQIRGRSLQHPATLYGARASRHISAGQTVTLRQVCLVCKGDNVVIIAKTRGLQVKTSGIAQQNGSLGDNIVILNPRSSKRIDARVVAVNRVEIDI